MKLLKWLIGYIGAFCLITVLLLSSVKILLFDNEVYFRREYQKYNVASAVKMEMDDLMKVTGEMMDYLEGQRANLDIPTVVDGREREFFNEKEKIHMADVKYLLQKGFLIRRAAGLLFLIASVFLFLIKEGRTAVLALKRGIMVFAGFFVVLAAVISTDFTRYFELFHMLFFTNDLWILDPAEDLLINIVPEGFFMDTAAGIGILFAAMTAAVFIACLIYLRKRAPKG